jgi:pyruvate/2-oxoglutarate/acetoin dehydrogenase E1 component
MRRDPKVFICGEDIAEAGHPFKVLTGLVQEFGTERVIDTPISEAGFTGIAVGAAMTGMKPVIDIMFGDFIGLTMDQMVNQAARFTTCPAANGSARWSCAPRSAPRDALPRSIPSRFTHGSAIFPA